MTTYTKIVKFLFLSLLALSASCKQNPSPGQQDQNDAFVAPSDLQYSTNPAIYTKATPITWNSPTSSGGKVADYSVSPALPSGLALDTTTGIISGTPSMSSATETYTVSASNSAGSTSVSLQITINDVTSSATEVPPANLQFVSNPVTFTLASTVSDTPTNSGGKIATYSITPALPAGLSIDASTGAISGTPMVVAPAADYTVTGINSAGSASVQVSLAVIDVAPSGLAFSTNPATYTKDIPIANNTPTNNGGKVTAYSVSPPLPAGFSLDASSGIISGTPMAVVASQTYVVNAKNSGGSTSTNLVIAVNDGSPSALTYSTNPVAYSVGKTITQNVPSNFGGTITSYSISPSLPTGLSLDPGTGKITGAPSLATPGATYTVTGSNSGGTTSAVLYIIVDVPCSNTQVTGSPFAGGTGTLADPYQICTVAHLKNVSSSPNSAFILLQSLDFSTETSPYGASFPLATGGFESTFDGNNKALLNFTLRGASGSGWGLFASIGQGGEVKNLILENATITNTSSGHTGILAGDHNGSVTNCHTSGAVSGISLAGGLFGAGSVTSHTMSSSSSAAVTASFSAGGLMGEYYQNGSTSNIVLIENSFSTGTVTATGGSAGGLVGQYGASTGESVTIKNSYSMASVGGTVSVGGLVGAASYFGDVLENTYFGGTVTQNATAGGSYIAAGGLIGWGPIDTGHPKVSQSFNAGKINASVGYIGAVVAVLEGGVSDTYWDISRSGLGNCTAAAASVAGCTGINAANSQPTYWFSSASAPLDSWDFSATGPWQLGTNSFPLLR